MAAVLAIPFVLIAFNSSRSFRPLEWAGLVLWLLAAPLEALADRQLKSFKADPANRGRTMRYGLWRYSRTRTTSSSG